jgi:hypothetical protein
MKRTTIVMTVLLAGSAASADTQIVPTAAASTGGSGAYSTVLHGQARSYQVVIGPAHLPTLAPGTAAMITGIQWRLASWQAFPAWPAVPVTFASFDVTLSKSLNVAGSLSSTYTLNIGPDAVLARSGPITFGAGAFAGGAVSPSFNTWGPVIQFASPYLYTGGDLLITIRHTGSGSTNGNLDWVGGAGCQAIGVSSYTQPDMWYAQGNNGAIACQLTYGVVPFPELCYADCDGVGGLTANDFACYLSAFVAGSSYANCDGVGGLTANDFSCFLNSYAAGCS